ncbi:AMP-binding protein [Prosthecobacter fusiformis]|nr:AMP-binding protein [Prosthecobacter fusiformis]
MPTDKPVSLKNLTLLGQENLPSKGGYLILPSQLSFLDLARLETLLSGQSIVYLMEKGAALPPQIKAYLEQEPPVPEPTQKDGPPPPPPVPKHIITTDLGDAVEFRKTLIAEIEKNAVIIYLPALAAAASSPLTTVPGSKLEFILKAACPLIPLYVQRSGDIALAIEGRYSDSAVVMALGPLIHGDDATLPAYQESLFVLAEKAFSQHPALSMHLAYAVLQGLKRHGSKHQVVDGKDDKVLGYDKVLAVAIALSKIIKEETTKKRVGIILPPGLGGLIANVAVLLAGKIPVNLNFTAGRTAIEFAMKTAELDRFITADIFVRKMQAFPWPAMKQLILIERILPRLKSKIALWLGLSKILPASILASVLGVPKKGGQEEAVLLFTSGSAGNPKGVALTHRNVMANVMQFSSRLAMNSTDSILGSLPLFHSFGSTVTLWYPLISGLNLVTYPSPLETKKLGELIEKHRVTLMIATPTFLRGYLRGVNRESLTSLKMVVTGAEKLPTTVSSAFEQRFDKKVFEGYGLTETSPVSNVNLPDPVPLGNEGSGHVWLPSHRPGSVGQLIPGLAIRITHPETNEPQSLHTSGMIWFKGTNVFEGYLKDPKRTAEVIDENGWFRTGDIGRVDMDGFLYIEGRLSRFSKIGGEMVPHETVEEALVKAMGLENETVRKIAVIGVPDVERGEALILLTAIPGGPEHQEILDLRYRLLEKGLPPLWIPKKMIRVADIPILSSGKLDVQSCEKIAKDGS